MSDFAKVAGQRVYADRPPKGYVVIINHDGKGLTVNRCALGDTVALSKWIERELSEMET